jgi:FKBP-type peptidyl-prolyl cis-trans isomerase FkpA
VKKTSSSPAAPAALRFWRSLAVISLAIIVGLLVGIWKQWGTRATAPAAVKAEPATPPVRPKPTGAYAALGSYMAENNRIADLGWTEAQFAEFLEGMRASFEGRGLPLDDDAKKLRDEISRKVQSMLAGEQPDPVEDYFRILREKEGALRTASGLHYRITEEGSGPKPKVGDTIVLSFSVRQPDGKERPELSRARVRLAVADLLPGLAEGVQLLSVGGKALVFVPAGLSFAEADWPEQVPKGMPLAFFIELHEIVGQEARNSGG